MIDEGFVFAILQLILIMVSSFAAGFFFGARMYENGKEK